MTLSPDTTILAYPARNTQLNDVLDKLAQRIPGVAHVIAVSGDGLRTATTRDLGPDRGDQLAAIVSGLASLAAGATRVLQTKAVRYQFLAMEEGTLVIQPLPDGSSLAALAQPDCDWSLVAYELANLAVSIGEAIALAPRPTG